MPKTVNLSTTQVVQRVGIGRVTLERWLASGAILQPQTVRFGKNEFRDWTPIDIDRILEHKRLHYRKGRGLKGCST